MEPYQRRVDEVLTALDTRASGLSVGEVKERLARYGRNELQRETGSGMESVPRAVQDALVLLLIVTGYLGRPVALRA